MMHIQQENYSYHREEWGNFGCFDCDMTAMMDGKSPVDVGLGLEHDTYMVTNQDDYWVEPSLDQLFYGDVVKEQQV